MDYARSNTTDPNTIQNYRELRDLVIRIELTRAFLIPQFTTFLRNSLTYFLMFLYLVTCFLRVTVSLLCRLQAVSTKHVPIYPDLIGAGRRNCSTLWPAQNETVTVRKHVTKYKHMRTWIIEFLIKLENRCIKITRVNSILVTKSTNLLQFWTVLAVRFDVDIFKLTSRA